MDSSGSVLARRRRSRRHAGLVARSAGGSGARGRDVRRSSSKPGSLVIVAAAAAATIVACSSAVQARDSATVSAGYQHTCLITADADVKCFGYNKNGELGLGDTSNRGDGSTNGGMGDDLGTVDLGTGAVALAVSSGWQHTCAVLDDGAVKCWGRNDKGQLGKGDYQDRGDDPMTMGNNLTAVDLGAAPSGNGSAVATAVTTGQQFTCVLVEGGAVKCFGRNDEGQCGRGDLEENVGSNSEDMGDNLPYVDLGEGVEAVSISSGTSSTCAALLGGGIKCWGGNAYGGLGVGDSHNVGDEATDMGDNMREVDLGTGQVGHFVVSGLRHVCAILAGGGVKCWGDNRSGQLGLGHVDTIGDDGDEMGDNLPFVDLGAGATATSLSLAESHTCAVLSDGTTRCWGKSFRGQLGRGEYYARGKYPGEMGTGLAVTDLGANATVSSLAAGGDHTCAALGDGSLKCWGMNTLGALGLGDTEDRGDDSGEMGDALPAVSLGTGVTVMADAGATLPPTPAPTAAPTTTPTTAPTAAAAATPQPSQAAVEPDASSPQPSPSPTPQPTPEPTPEPTTAATEAATEAAVSREIETAGDGDDGVFAKENITVAAYVAVPLLAFALLACFCAVRRRRRSDTDAGGASGGAWAGGSAAKGGGAAVSGVAGAGAGARGAMDSGGSGKIHPASTNISPHNRNTSGNNGVRVEDMNLAEHIVVGTSAAGGHRQRQGEGGEGKKNPKKMARCESGTAFAMTSSENIPDDYLGANGARAGAGGAGGGGVGSDSSGGAGTGRSASPPGYADDAAGSTFDSSALHGDVEDDLSENGWGPPSYEETAGRREY